tara:strand:- start:145 stop:1476 length:1332 start_codon:yes stop_codon:yes gene_type:complete
MDSSATTKEHIKQVLFENFEEGVLFSVQQVYDLVLVHNRIDELYDGKCEEEVVRAACQRLRNEGILEFVDDDGTYRIVSIKTTKSDLRDPNFFSIDDLVKYGRINQKAPKITFDPNVIYDGVNNLVGWAILNKNEVINHTLSEKLGLKTQTRSGKATFPKTIADINESIDEDGYDYRSFQPAVSVLDEPIEFEGLTYKYVVRDGNNRYETAWQYFPCAVIQGESEYYLRHYGAVANNPVANELKNNITEDDVKIIIQEGLKEGVIEKTREAVIAHLKAHFPKMRSGSRKHFAAEILGAVGIRASMESYNVTLAHKALGEYEDINKDEVSTRIEGMGEDDNQFVIGLGRSGDHDRKMRMILDKQLEFPENTYTMLAFLEDGEGVAEDPTANNIDRLRVKFEGLWKKHIQHCITVADAYRKNKLTPLNVKWLMQSNDTEERGKFY